MISEDTDADDFPEPMESSMIQMDPVASVETDSGKMGKKWSGSNMLSWTGRMHLLLNSACITFPGGLCLKERLESMFLDLTKKLDNPDFTPSIASFVESYESIQTDGAMASALSSFGKSNDF